LALRFIQEALPKERVHVLVLELTATNASKNGPR